MSIEQIRHEYLRRLEKNQSLNRKKTKRYRYTTMEKFVLWTITVTTILWTSALIAGVIYLIQKF